MSIQRLTIPNGCPIFGGPKLFENFNYSPAVRANGFLYIAGQVGLRPDGSIPESISEQTHWAFKRLLKILEYANLDSSHLVELVSYHVRIAEHLTTFQTIKDEYLIDHAPTWTILGIQALARDSLLIEIKATAAITITQC